MKNRQDLAELPAVHEVLSRMSAAVNRFPRSLVVTEIRRALEYRREAIRSGRDISLPLGRSRNGSKRAALTPKSNQRNGSCRTNLGTAR